MSITSSQEKREREENIAHERKIRNFRSVYYEKVGFMSLDGSKLLGMIMEEKPFNLTKLESFVQKFSVPHVQREEVWMFLMGFVSPDVEDEDFILNEQKIVGQDLLRTLFVLGLIDDNTPMDKQITLMYLLNRGSLSFYAHNQFDDTEKKNLLAIASAFCELSPLFENTYWMFKGFVDGFSTIKISISEVKIDVKTEFKSKHPELDNHLHLIDGYDQLPLQIWSDRCFAGIVDSDSAVKIWDKVVAGSYVKIFPAVCKYLVWNLRTEIMELNQPSAIRILLLKPMQLDVKFESIINISCDDKVVNL